MPITPDTKDWTWVLERPCPECGFDTRAFPKEELGAMIRQNASGWPPVLAHPDVRLRPSDNVWSALEYGCHVRDVFRLYDSRLQMMLENEGPTFPNWDQDATAIERRYSEQAPAEVLAELEEGAHDLAARFDAVRGAEWQRTGIRSDGARFTIESFGRYLIHDPIHHLHDVERGFSRLRGR
jgi:DinB superfamily